MFPKGMGSRGTIKLVVPSDPPSPDRREIQALRTLLEIREQELASEKSKANHLGDRSEERRVGKECRL